MDDRDLRYPLTWPHWQSRTPAILRKRSRYGTKTPGRSWGTNPLTVAQAMSRLLDELQGWVSAGLITASDRRAVIVSSNLQLRNDGHPRSGQREPDDTGVCVYLTIAGGPRALPSDQYDRVADNINAVREWLAGQRQAHRSGVGSLEATFAGYPALPPETTTPSWWVVLGLRDRPKSLEDLKRAYYKKSQENHPDAGGDKASRAAWDAIQAAYEQGKSFFSSVPTSPH